MTWTKRYDQFATSCKLRQSSERLCRWLLRRAKPNQVCEIEIDLRVFNQEIARDRHRPYDRKTQKEALAQLDENTQGLILISKSYTWAVHKILVRPLEMVLEKKSQNGENTPKPTTGNPMFSDAHKKRELEQLATKAELQELRDQLNAVLGEKEDGSTQPLFAPGATSTIVTAGAGLTLLGMAKTTAPKAVVDILLEGSTTGTTWQKLASSNTGLKAKFGNGSLKTVPAIDKIANTAGQSVKAGNAGAGIGKAGGASVAVLANLVTIGATLALNKATVDIIDNRFEAESKGQQLQLDVINSGMLRLYEKNNGDIDQANLELESQGVSIRNQATQIELARSDIQDLAEQNIDLNNS